MKTLILTEKPSVARDFAKALGIRGKKDGYIQADSDIVITWAIGHLVELAEPGDYSARWKKWQLGSLPILPEQFQYKPIQKTRKQLRIITRLLKTHAPDRVIIATDAGREGEVIARTILMHAGFEDSQRLVRFWTSQALTPAVVRSAMESLQPASEYDRLWDAGKCRQMADWLVGMNGSRAATIRMNDLFSVGRVQTAVLALLVDRKRQRDQFQPELYWLVRCRFSHPKGDYQGLWFHDKQVRILSESQAKAIVAQVDQQSGIVVSVKKQTRHEPPPLLLSLTDLQREANLRHGFSAKKTLNLAQSLYEEKKCLSYPRTDSRVLGSKNVGLAKGLIEKLSPVYETVFAGVEPETISVTNKRVFNDARLTDHHALIPLDVLPDNATADEAKVYDIVLKRFAAAFHPNCQYKQTEIITQVQSHHFRTRGRQILVPGWRQVPDIVKRPAKTGQDESEQDDLPAVSQGDSVNVAAVDMEKKQTQPPPDYTDALLLKDMTNPAKYVSEKGLKSIYSGDVGLGTQSTRAQIIETLLSRKYAVRRKKYIQATEKGCRLIDTLRQFPCASKLTSASETARWEMALDRISRGSGSSRQFMADIREFVSQMVQEFKTWTPSAVHSNLRPTLGKCPMCGGNIIKGKRGFGCENWHPDRGGCRFVIWQTISGRLFQPQEIARLLTHHIIGPLDGFVSPSGKPFSATVRLDKDQQWKTVVEPIHSPNGHQPPLGTCPLCGGQIIQGQKGYGCANWRKQHGGCRFVIWKQIYGRAVSESELQQLLTEGMTDTLDGFQSPRDTPVSGKLKLTLDGPDTFCTLIPESE